MTRRPVITEQPAETLGTQHIHVNASTGTMETVVNTVSGTHESFARFLFFSSIEYRQYMSFSGPVGPYREKQCPRCLVRPESAGCTQDRLYIFANKIPCTPLESQSFYSIADFFFVRFATYSERKCLLQEHKYNVPSRRSK